MPYRLGIATLAVLGLAVGALRAEPAHSTSIVCDKGASFAERLAGKEVRRYVYLRTGKLLPILDNLPEKTNGSLIVVGEKGRTTVQSLLLDSQLKATINGLAPQQYAIKTVEFNGRPACLIAGGDAVGTLYGAYRFAEHLGVRFYLHGDVVPDRRIALALPTVDEVRKPLFDLRGIQPFHDFPEGPDWWSREGYKAILGQLPKMGMNFFGLHTYPEGDVGPEPLVWIGTQDEITPDGKVKASYPSRHFTTGNVTGAIPLPNVAVAWGYQPEKTSDYCFGAADLFDRDDYGADHMRDTYPWNKMSPEQCNALFDRMGEFLGDVFTFAQHMGIKTCIGTETPLVAPVAVKQRLAAAGRKPAESAVVQSLYEGIFQRITKTHSLDYYWLWTPEDWTWRPVTQQQIGTTMADLRAAIAAAKKVNVPFTLATCGWVLGPPQSPTLFDETLPKDMPMSCINRMVGNTPVEPGFAKVQGRPKWAIPWLEDDPGLTMPQLWVGRMRRDAADARKYGCTGLMGIHWRTRVLAPNVSVLAKAAWDQAGWSQRSKETMSPVAKSSAAVVIGHAAPSSSNPITGPDLRATHLPVADFYADWARTEFGPEAAKPIAAVFARLDGRLPRPADWVTGPGGIRPDERPWQQGEEGYAFVDELTALRPRIDGPGNLERFDYWLNNFRYLGSIAKVRCDWGRFNSALAKVKAEKDRQTQKKLARELALPARRELVAAFAEMHRYLLATVTNPGEMGNVCNWQQQTLPVLLTAPGQELAKLLGEDLPADAVPSKQYLGEPRIFVPEVRTSIMAGESLRLTAIILGPRPQEAVVCWRPLGAGEFIRMPLVHVARGVYTVTLPADTLKSDIEYYVQATVGGKSIVFPPTAPTIGQTVVVP
jgi:hypothetical protein